MIHNINRFIAALALLATAQGAWADTETITVGGTDYTLFTGFTATGGSEGVGGAFTYDKAVDGDISSSWHDQSSGVYVEFNTDDPIVPKGYIFNTYMEGYFYPHAWVLKAKANTTDDWTTLSSYSGQSLSSGQEFQYACNNDGNTAYKYFRFEASNTNNNIWLTEIRLYGSSPDVYYTHLTKKDATCTETGIKQDCYQRNDGKYFTDNTGETEIPESDVIAPMIPHTGVHHEATDVNIEYWQCSMCSKYFSNEGCTTEITEEETKIYRTITIDGSISGLVTSNVNQALAGASVTLTVSQLIDASTLKVNNGAVELTDIGSNQYTFTVPAADVTVTAETLSTYSFSLPDNMEIVSASNEADGNGKYISGTVITFAPSLRYSASNVSDGTNTLEPDANGVYTVTIENANINITATVVGSSTLYLAEATSDFTAADGETLVGSTSHTVTIANGANITLNNATITGGIVCEGTATITLDGTNSVSVVQYKKAGIQIGSSGTTLTIRGDGSLTATGGSAAAGIGLGRTWDASVTAGAIVIEGGTVNASGDIGIGIGTVGNSKTATIDGISIKGGTVSASLGKGNIYNLSTATVGYIKIYDTIDMVDASKITETVTYMHVDGESATDVTASKTDYFTIGENGDRRIIVPKDDTDYTITIADGIEHGTITGAATAKYMETVTINATPAFGYRFVRLVVKDADNNDVASTGNTFLMPKSNVTVSAEFEQGVHGTTEFTWGYYGPASFVNEATIYDGVTTVNIQQTEQSYNILKYDENTYSKFRLDNNTDYANIPYAGGTGEFQNGNGTYFNAPYDGQTGYYDITMTDAGNGKWGVSIQKTAGQMDVVPDQTYTGSAITPEPLVIAGSLSLTKGTDYVYSYENNINVGTATVRATFQGDYASLGSVEKEFTIAPWSGTGDSADPYMIYNKDQLLLLAHRVNGTSGETANTYQGKYFKLGADITFTHDADEGDDYAENYVPIGGVFGGYSYYFKGNFDGDGHTVSGIRIRKDGTGINYGYVGLFGYLDEGSNVHDVHLTDARIKGDKNVGGIAGYTYGIVSGCSVTDSYITASDEYGTICGENDGTLTNNYYHGCTVNGTPVTSGVGCEGADITAGNGALPAYAITLGANITTPPGTFASHSEWLTTPPVDARLAPENGFTLAGNHYFASGYKFTPGSTLASGAAQGYTPRATLGGQLLAPYTPTGDDDLLAGTAIARLTVTADCDGKTLAAALRSDGLQHEVSYIKADGTTQTAQAIALDGHETVSYGCVSLAGGTYYVGTDIAYANRIMPDGEVTLILADGKTMTLNGNTEGIDGYNLTIYGQSLDDATAGTLRYNGKLDGIHAYYYEQHSGNVSITTTGSGVSGIVAYVTLRGGTLTVTANGDNARAINGTTHSILGGQLTATGAGTGIYASADDGTAITLGWTRPADRITASSISTGGGTVAVKDGQALTDGSGNIYTGTLTAALAALAGKTLQPCAAVTFAPEGYATYYDSQYDVTLPAGVKARIVTANDGGTLTYATIADGDDNTNNTVPAGTAVMLQTAPADAAQTKPLLIAARSAAYAGDNLLHGSDDATTTTGDGKHYKLSYNTSGTDLGWYWGTDDGAPFTTAAHKAWLVLPNGTNARSFALPDFGETTTLIDNGQWTIDNEAGAWFTINGVKLSGKPTKAGLYIVNGKKVMIK